jgi:hypothetical protein
MMFLYLFNAAWYKLPFLRKKIQYDLADVVFTIMSHKKCTGFAFAFVIALITPCFALRWPCFDSPNPLHCLCRASCWLRYLDTPHLLSWHSALRMSCFVLVPWPICIAQALLLICNAYALFRPHCLDALHCNPSYWLFALYAFFRIEYGHLLCCSSCLMLINLMSCIAYILNCFV